MKKILCMMVVVVCILTSLLSCHSKDHDEPQQDWEKEIDDLKTNFMNRYQPMMFPPQGFTGIRVFSHNLKQLLVNQDGKPVIFEGFLDDITKIENQFFVHFTSRLSDDDSDDRTVRFHLKCTYSHVQSLIEHPPAYFDSSKYLFLKGIRKDFLVVAKITDVKKIVNYTVLGTSSEGAEDVDLEIRSPDTFSVYGELLEMFRYARLLE